MRNKPVRISKAAFTAMWMNQEVTTTEMAIAFGVHRSTASELGRRLGLPPRVPGRKRSIPVQPFTNWWLAGVAGKDISAALGLHGNYPYHFAEKLGLPPRGRGFRPISLQDYLSEKLRENMKISAAETKAAMRLSEMVDRPTSKTARLAA